MYLISVYFDAKTNKILQKHINEVSEVTGNDFMLSHKVPPHLTILQLEARSEKVLEPYMADIRGKSLAGWIDIVSVGMFLPRVLYLTPVYNECIDGILRLAYDVFSGIPEVCINKYYRPFSFQPHITVGKTLSEEQMGQAFEKLQRSFVPIRGRIMEIGLSKVNPHEDIVRFAL